MEMIQVKENVQVEKKCHQKDFHYRFEKELGMAKDKESGKAAPCYVKVSIRSEELIPEEQLNSWHMSRAPLYNPAHVYTEAELLHITPITEEEYKEKQVEGSKVQVGDILSFYL